MILCSLGFPVRPMIPQHCPSDSCLNRWNNSKSDQFDGPQESRSKSECIDSILSCGKQVLSMLNESNQSSSVHQQIDIREEAVQKKREQGTIGELIDEITFKKKKHIRKNNHKSETGSLENSYEFDSKSSKSDQSKCWSQEEEDLFYELLEKYGTDFNFIKQSFPRKSKSQIKNKYKQIAQVTKKMKKKCDRDKQKGLLQPGMKEMKEIQEESENQVIK